MTPERYYKIRQVLDQRQPDLTVLADGVHKAQNLSAIIRTCDAVGVSELHIVAAPGQRTGIWKRSAGGSAQWVKAHRHGQVETAVRHLQNQGMVLYAAHLGAQTVDYRHVDYTRPCAIVLGAEKNGVSATALAASTQAISIPMAGMVESFNVSVAAALILAEARHQREQAQLYISGPRIPEKEYQRTLFEWCQPKLARYCQEKGLNYPDLDHEGDLLEPSSWYAEVRSRLNAEPEITRK